MELRLSWIILIFTIYMISGPPAAASPLKTNQAATVAKTAETRRPKQAFYLSMEITNRIYNNSLRNPESTDYKNMYAEVSGVLQVVYNCTGCGTSTAYQGVAEMTFSNGSVIANSTIMFQTGTTNAVLLKSLFNVHLKTSNMTNGLIISRNYIKVGGTSLTTTTTPLPTTTRTTTPANTTTAHNTTTVTSNPPNNTTTTTNTTTVTSIPPNNTTTTTNTTTVTSIPPNNTTTTTNTTTVTSNPPNNTTTTTNTTTVTSKSPNNNTTSSVTTSNTTSFSNTTKNHTSISNTSPSILNNTTKPFFKTTTHHAANTSISSPSIPNNTSTSTTKTRKTEAIKIPTTNATVSPGGAYYYKEVPGWAIALLVLACIILLLLIILLIITLIRWCCWEPEKEPEPLPPLPEQHTPYERKTFKEPLSLPSYSPQTPQKSPIPASPFEDPSKPRVNRTGMYVVNPES